MGNESKITNEKGIIQTGEIKVAAKIIDDLSSGIYSSPAIALKELVNNSYDADAKTVTIRILPTLDTIHIVDDGSGMNYKDFREDFAWISKSNKRNNGNQTPLLKRKLIGKIGIGFIAVNEICHKMEVISSKKDEDIKFTATIDFDEISNAKNTDEDDVIKAEYTLINEDEERDKHYTIIKLTGIRQPVQEIFQDKLYKDKEIKKLDKKRNISYFKNMKELLESHYKNNFHTFAEDSAYIRFVIDLASYIPVEYMKDAPIQGINDKIINEIVEEQKNLDFKVDLDGIYLKKPIFFEKNEYVKSDYYSFDHVVKVKDHDDIKFKGYFYCQKGSIFPKELNGIAIRIKGIPIARRFGFDNTFMDYPNYTDQLFMNWVSGELYVESGLEEAMNIDRQSFRETHPSYIALQEYMHKLLRETVFGKIVYGLYKEGRSERDEEKRDKIEAKLKEIIGAKNITFNEVKVDKKDISNSIPLKIETKGNEAFVTFYKDTKSKYSKSEWNKLQNIFIIFETAFKESGGDAEKLRELFYSKMASNFKKKRLKG